MLLFCCKHEGLIRLSDVLSYKIWNINKTVYVFILKIVDNKKKISLPNFAMLYILFTNVNVPLRIPAQ